MTAGWPPCSTCVARWSEPRDGGLPDVVENYESLIAELSRSKPADDPRTIDQWIADELYRRCLTTGDGEPDIQLQLAITIPVTSLAGLSDEPGTSLDGRVTYTPEVVRELASRAGTVLHRVITDPLGKVLDVTRIGRFATGELDFALDVRDGTCQFPTCSRPAEACEKDHQTPWPHGPTSGDNLWSLCRRHHRMKTAGILTPEMNENNDVFWRMPSGKRVYPEQAEHSQRELNGSRVEFALAQLNVEFHRAA